MKKAIKKMLFIRTAIIILITITIAYYFYTSYSKITNTFEKAKEDLCQKDSDCVPSSCCHSSFCIAKRQAPSCAEFYCTQECEPGTLDCGQAYCSCVNNKCEKKSP